MNVTQYDMLRKTRDFLNESPVKLYICTVNSVDTENLTAEVFVSGIASTIKNVPILGFSRIGGAGTITLPTANSTGILAVTAKRQNVLLGTISGATASKIAEKLFPGEMLFQSPGGAYVKLDRKGNVMAGSSAGGVILMDTEGRVSVWSETAYMNTSAQKTLSGRIGDEYGTKEEVFDGDFDSDDTIEEIVDKILKDDHETMTSRQPCIIIEKGAVVGDDGDRENLSIHDDPQNDKEIIMRIRIKDRDTGGDNACVAFDSEGNVKISGNTLHLDFNTVKTTYVTKIDDPRV
jgi:hypothetical protein